ncbi:MAG: glycosyltransferase family 1 protein, partial [Chloroflexota bacterium]
MAHIGIDARITDYRIGGISTYARQLIAALAAQISGDQLTVFQSRRMRAPVDDRLTTRRLLTPPHHRIERSALSLELLRH